MIDPVYALVWPRPLFEWEARRLLKHRQSSALPQMIEHLLHEAYEDTDVATNFSAAFPAHMSAGPSSEYGARAWLTDILKDDTRLQEYRAPKYWAERSGRVVSNVHARTFPQDFFKLIGTLQDTGYFPKVLRKDCVDDWSDPAEAREAIHRATGLDLPWPITDADMVALDEAALYSLIEFFHDQAQRPRTTSDHNFSDCGLHYHEHDNTSGRSVYRWRVNTLLASHNVPLELGTTGEERGRLIRKTNSPLDDLAAEQITRRADTPSDEVAHAVRMFRQRHASPIDKRAAITLLFGELEPRRGVIEKKVATQDASDLFQIANKFTFRHRDKLQRSDYGDEFLDWIFWTNLAMIRLLDDLEKKTQDEKAG